MQQLIMALFQFNADKMTTIRFNWLVLGVPVSEFYKIRNVIRTGDNVVLLEPVKQTFTLEQVITVSYQSRRFVIHVIFYSMGVWELKDPLRWVFLCIHYPNFATHIPVKFTSINCRNMVNHAHIALITQHKFVSMISIRMQNMNKVTFGIFAISVSQHYAQNLLSHHLNIQSWYCYPNHPSISPTSHYPTEHPLLSVNRTFELPLHSMHTPWHSVCAYYADLNDVNECITYLRHTIGWIWCANNMKYHHAMMLYKKETIMK
jgi:hypothetical protein